MLFVLIALWLTGAVLIVVDPRRSSTRWLAALTFSGGCGALAAQLDDVWRGYAALHWPSEGLSSALEHLQLVSSLTSYYGVPYSFLMFAIRYHAPYRWLAGGRGWPAWLLLPIAACLLLFRPFYPIPYLAVTAWALPYVAFGTFLVLGRKEPLPAMRRNHAFTSVAIVPAVLFCTVMNYLLPSFGVYEMWRYNTWMILFAFTVFVIALFNFGFLGIQFYIRQRRLDHTLRAITSGTAILNHAIKNDVGKMKLFCDKMRRYAEETGQTELVEDLRTVMNASQHVQDMIRRVHDRTQDLALRKERLPLSRVIEETLHGLEPTLTGFSVRTELAELPELPYDRAQVAEVLNNVITNAVEASGGSGSLAIRLYRTKKTAVIEIRDSGPGIDKNKLRQVLEPFYTTKSGGSLNFGLGLAYSYHVMKKHGGTLEIKSESGKGTTVYLEFPLKGGVQAVDESWRSGAKADA